jgi:hypothetical protein
MLTIAIFFSKPVVSGTTASAVTSSTAPTTNDSKYGSSSSLTGEPLRSSNEKIRI